MLFLILLHVTSADFKLNQYDRFQIDLDPRCKQYFTLLGPYDYINLTKSHGDFLLLVGGKESYQLYTAPYKEYLVFNWPDKTINGEKMVQIESEGTYVDQLELSETSIPCEVYGLRVGSLFTDVELASLTYQCPTISNWKIYFPVALTIILSLFLAIGGYKTIEPRILRRRLEQVEELGEVYSEIVKETRV